MLHGLAVDVLHMGNLLVLIVDGVDFSFKEKIINFR